MQAMNQQNVFSNAPRKVCASESVKRDGSVLLHVRVCAIVMQVKVFVCVPACEERCVSVDVSE